MRTLIAVLIAALLAGCSTTNNTQTYGVSMENNQLLKSLENPRQIMVGSFTTSGPNSASIGCRSMGLSINVPASSFESYIRDALVDELKLAGIYSINSKTVLTTNFEKIDFSSTFSGNWIISAQFSFPDQKPFTVTSNYSFSDVNYGMQLACANTAAAFEPAVQNFIKNLFIDTRFREAVTQHNIKTVNDMHPMDTTDKNSVDVYTIVDPDFRTVN